MISGKSKETAMSKKYLGIELGSTRIKAACTDASFKVTETGGYVWESRCENGVWIYDIAEAIEGVKAALSQISCAGEVCAVGISGMMHGYLAFDDDWNLLVPFRTWQNRITGEASEVLEREFGCKIPQRWSIAHLYQAILNNEEHVERVAHITTLAGYIHYLLTGKNCLGICEASGMFPIYEKTYNAELLEKFDALSGLKHKIKDILPRVAVAGECGGYVTERGSKLFGGYIAPGTLAAPPEGDAGTGMVATNAVAPGTGNISAGTSIFSMVVLKKPLSRVYRELDIVTTPDGSPVAMVHCVNCTRDSNEWISIVREAVGLFADTPSDGELYARLYEKSLEGDADCGGVLVCNYLAGEGITDLSEGRPLVVRRPSSHFALANFMRAQIYSAMSTLMLGMEILKTEGVEISSISAHGGLFKTKGVGQRYLAAAVGSPVVCMETAGEGGAYGMALLAAFAERGMDCTLAEFLDNEVFSGMPREVLEPNREDADGFRKYLEDYKALVKLEKAAVELL